MRTHRTWLAYAAQTKAKVNKLPRSTGRDQIIYLAYLIAKDRHRYVGTLGDWEFVVNEAKNQRERTSRK